MVFFSVHQSMKRRRSVVRNIPTGRWFSRDGHHSIPMNHLLKCLLASFALLPAAGTARAEVALAAVFGDHMVLQRDMPVPVWGTAAPGAKVTVTFGGSSASAVAGQDGRWRAQLGPLAADAHAATLVVTSGEPNSKGVRVEDVLVGEVWVGAGQSNMQGPASMFMPGMKTGDTVLSKSPGDKMLADLVNAGPYPEVRINGDSTNSRGKIPPAWLVATPDNLRRFSAQLQSFGIQLHQKLHVPVGLILAAVGGTPSGQWVSGEAVASDPGCQQAIAKANATFSMEAEQQKYQAALMKYQADAAAWNQLPDTDKKTKPKPREPFPPVRPGESTDPRAAIGTLHDHVLGPYIGYGIRGVLWDQGESGTSINGLDQYTVMGALIRSWRKEWGQGDFPFLYVEKPSGGGCAFDPSDKIFGWAADPFVPLPATVPGGSASTREMYMRIATYPNTFMAPTSDLGGNTHPWNKTGYATRDLQVALGAVYGQKVEISGPAYAGSTVEGDKIRVRFDHAGKGLTFRNGDRLQGFAVAGADKKFVWADATIEGAAVVVSSGQVPNPAFVRYAWSDRHPWANLFNLDGLPALEFATDAGK
jgi:sialate O-acetylesterase